MWVRIDDHYHQNKKTQYVGQAAADLNVAALEYCNTHLTDGFIPAVDVPKLRSYRYRARLPEWATWIVALCEWVLRERLVDSITTLTTSYEARRPMWHRAEREGVPGYQINDFNSYQPKRNEVLRNRNRAAENRRTRRQNQRAAQTDNPLQATAPPTDRLWVYQRDKGICGICHQPVDKDIDWEVDHIVPLCKGGEDAYFNVQLAHGTCNVRKGGRVLLENNSSFSTDLSRYPAVSSPVLFDYPARARVPGTYDPEKNVPETIPDLRTSKVVLLSQQQAASTQKKPPREKPRDGAPCGNVENPNADPVLPAFLRPSPGFTPPTVRDHPPRAGDESAAGPPGREGTREVRVDSAGLRLSAAARAPGAGARPSGSSDDERSPGDRAHAGATTWSEFRAAGSTVATENLANGRIVHAHSGSHHANLRTQFLDFLAKGKL